MDTRLSLNQRQNLIDLLLACFSSGSQLEQFVYYRTDTRLNHIVGQRNLREQVTALIDWAELNPPAVAQIVQGLTEERAGRTDVWQIAGEFAAAGLIPPVSRPGAASRLSAPPRVVYNPPPAPIPLPPPPPRRAEMSGQERRQLMDLLAGLDMRGLELTAQLATDEPLNRHANTATVAGAAFDLIQFCESRGRIGRLFRAALRAAPDLTALAALQAHLEARGVLPT